MSINQRFFSYVLVALTLCIPVVVITAIFCQSPPTNEVQWKEFLYQVGVVVAPISFIGGTITSLFAAHVTRDNENLKLTLQEQLADYNEVIDQRKREDERTYQLASTELERVRVSAQLYYARVSQLALGEYEADEVTSAEEAFKQAQGAFVEGWPAVPYFHQRGMELADLATVLSLMALKPGYAVREAERHILRQLTHAGIQFRETHEGDWSIVRIKPDHLKGYLRAVWLFYGKEFGNAQAALLDEVFANLKATVPARQADKPQEARHASQ